MFGNMDDDWIADPRFEKGSETTMEHRNGVEWADAPLPFWLHRCKPQTRGWVGFDRVERCACGATRFPLRFGKGWTGRNETRRYRLRDRTRVLR